MGYDGVIVTDALNMSAITEHFDRRDVAKYALNAGVDILLMPLSLLSNNGTVDEYVDMVANLVDSGEVSESAIDESVYRILTLKHKAGMLTESDFNLTGGGLAAALETVGSKEHHDAELEIAKDAVTLVKNDELLPLDAEGKVLFLNAYANIENSIEYAIQLLKEQDVLDDNFEYEISDFEKKNFSELKRKIDGASAVVITAETARRADFNNDDEKGWQGRFIDRAISEIHKQNKKVALISCALPYDAARYDSADALLCTYGNRAIPVFPIEYDGETRTFGANIPAAVIKLFDGTPFTGTLPVDVYEIDENYSYTDRVKYGVE